MQISDEESSDDDAVCPKCGLMYSADNGVWICCDGCDSWYDLKCTNIRSRRNVPDIFYCENCVDFVVLDQQMLSHIWYLVSKYHHGRMISFLIVLAVIMMKVGRKVYQFVSGMGVPMHEKT